MTAEIWLIFDELGAGSVSGSYLNTSLRKRSSFTLPYLQEVWQIKAVRIYNLGVETVTWWKDVVIAFSSKIIDRLPIFFNLLYVRSLDESIRKKCVCCDCLLVIFVKFLFAFFLLLIVAIVWHRWNFKYWKDVRQLIASFSVLLK